MSCVSGQTKTAGIEPVPSPEDVSRPPSVRPPAHNPLPNVYASRAGETVYFIKCGKRSVLVDTGYVHNCEAHLSNFENAGLDLSSVDAILNTHFHVDHAAGLARIRELLGCPVISHKNSVEVLATANRMATASEMPYIAGWNFPFPPCSVDVVVENGDDIVVGSTSFRVVHLPGHTPGCIGYLWDDMLVTGDVVFPPGRLPWNDVHWGSNYLDTIDTMQRLAELNPSHLLPTHGLPFPYTPEVSDYTEQAAKEMLESGKAGPMGHTQRAPLASVDRVPRRLTPRRLSAAD
jgi:glyoxylase-like metal-dependent hydrolase (beta-lactamase superfamily II)